MAASTSGKGKPTPRKGASTSSADGQHTVFRLSKDWSQFTEAEKAAAVEKITRETYDRQ